MVFEFKRKKVTVEAYGNSYEIPTKTVAFADELAAAQKRINEAKTTHEETVAVLDGIAKLFIGEVETNRIFPREKINEIDVDELAAFWLELKNASNVATQEVIKKYSPNTAIRK